MDEPGRKQRDARVLLELGGLPTFITKPTLIMVNIHACVKDFMANISKVKLIADGF